MPPNKPPNVGITGLAGEGAIGAGFGAAFLFAAFLLGAARFFAFLAVLLTALFAPFFLAGAARLAFLDFFAFAFFRFFAMINLWIGSNQNNA